MGKNFCNVENKWCKLLRRGVCKVANTELNNVKICPRIAEIETTTLYTLIREVKFEDVFKRICYYFEGQRDSKDGYKSAFNELMAKKRRKHNLSDLFIRVEVINEDGSDYLNIDGINIKNGKHYGIEFCNWEDWVSMFIQKETLDTLSKEDIVAGCLYEMTFFGFSEKRVQEENEKMQKSVEEAKKLI
jgi:hypothetical protein